jgi:hypothetical protein
VSYPKQFWVGKRDDQKSTLTVGNDESNNVWWIAVESEDCEHMGYADFVPDPAEVEKLVAAILNAADCRLERLVFPEETVKGMHGMTVVKRGE